MFIKACKLTFRVKLMKVENAVLAIVQLQNKYFYSAPLTLSTTLLHPNAVRRRFIPYDQRICNYESNS